MQRKTLATAIHAEGEDFSQSPQNTAAADFSRNGILHAENFAVLKKFPRLQGIKSGRSLVEIFPRLDVDWGYLHNARGVNTRILPIFAPACDVAFTFISLLTSFYFLVRPWGRGWIG